MNKHTATFDGHTLTRNSLSRTYTHTVIVVEDLSAERQRTERSVRDYWDGGGQAFQQRIAADEAYGAARRKEAADYLAGGVEGAVARVLAAFDSRPRLLSADGKRFYWCAGWCSRLDLAQKLSAKHPGSVIVAAAVVQS